MRLTIRSNQRKNHKYDALIGNRQKFFLTEEQQMKILQDDAIFSHNFSVRTKAINGLAHCFGMKANPMIVYVVDSLPCTTNEEAFRQFCLNTVMEIRRDETFD